MEGEKFSLQIGVCVIIINQTSTQILECRPQNYD